MEEKLKALRDSVTEKLDQIADSQTLEDVRVGIFGKNGEFTKLAKELSDLAKEERPIFGKLVNDAKKDLEALFASKQSQTTTSSASMPVDITAPGIRPSVGHLHPITQAIWDISAIFEKLGFEISDTREIETDWYAFGALNFPENHPARDEWETFFIDKKNVHVSKGDEVVLTPHTSSAQTRVMGDQTPPIRNITISKCYRRQADVSHIPMFHQFEGIFVDTDVSIAHLKGTLDFFAKSYFGPNRRTRIRPYDFRFTEPSFEVDISCSNCDGKGCRLCKQGWLELGGAGMIHPNVLKNSGVDAKKYNGFAFGWGVERVWMMQGGIKLPDIRTIYSNDLRFINQF